MIQISNMMKKQCNHNILINNYTILKNEIHEYHRILKVYNKFFNKFLFYLRSDFFNNSCKLFYTIMSLFWDGIDIIYNNMYKLTKKNINSCYFNF